MSIILGNGDALKDLPIGNKKISKVVVGNKVVWQLRKQIINYRLLYHVGNEFINVAGTDEEKYAISTGGWLFTKLGPDRSNAVTYLIKTTDYINTEGLNKLFLFTNRLSTMDDVEYGYNGYRKSGDHWYLNNRIYNQLRNSGTYKKFLLSDNFNQFNDSMTILPTHLSDLGYANKQSNFFKIVARYSGSYNKSELRLYSIGFVKIDDISGLSTYGSDIATILSNATNLFTDVSALNRMVLNCTGDFMISALSNTNFINAMNSSPNKTILLENEHWNRFIQLLSI